MNVGSRVVGWVVCCIVCMYCFLLCCDRYFNVLGEERKSFVMWESLGWLGWMVIIFVSLNFVGEKG